jgi:two-component system, OmpR family, response regulator
MEHQLVDAVLCDAVLPDGSGVDVCRQLRAKSKDMRVILTSRYAAPLPTKAWEEKTGNRFLSKPYSAESLITTLRRILANTPRPRDPLLPGLIPERVENLPG